MSGQFRLIYDVKDFASREEANAHFEEHWATHNPRVFVDQSKTVRSEFEGAHYREGRWRLIRKLEIVNYTNFEAVAPTPGAENAIARCSHCGQTGFYYRLAYPSADVYVHIASIQDGVRIELARHVIQIPEGGLINHSDFKVSS